MRSIHSTCLMLLACLATTGHARAQDWSLQPFAIVVGGIKYEDNQAVSYSDPDAPKPPGDDKDALYTMAVSRFGLRGLLPEGFVVVSEFELNAGVNGHGSSVGEGQAALQARLQMISFRRFGLRLDAGHVQDDSSIDFFSEHVSDMLLTDNYTRSPYLASGANRGNGLYITYNLLQYAELTATDLSLGFTVNSGSPLVTTISPAIGGSFPPYPNFYGGILKVLGDSPYRLPPESLDLLVLSPSLTFNCPWLQLQATAQFYRVDTSIASDKDDPIEGHNLRAGLKARIWEGRIVPFFNFSRSSNNTIGGVYSPSTMEGQGWEGMTVGGGLDVALLGKSGVGGQVVYVWGQQGDSLENKQLFINVGATWWLDDFTSVGLRFGYFHFENDDRQFGDRSYFLTVRTFL